MCLLVVCDKGSTPSREELQQGATTNPHGFGFAIIAGDKIISERTMSAKRSIARFLMFREQYPDSYAIWHSRIATHGVKNESNCHPFRVGQDKLTYLAHNGVLHGVVQPENDRRSDTRVFAEEVFPSMGGVCSLDNPSVFGMLEDWARGSKLAILTLDPLAQRNLYILNEKSGSWDSNSVWWSNTRHRPTPPRTWGGDYLGKATSKYNSLGETEVISYYNSTLGVWVAAVTKYWRPWKTGDMWDQDKSCFRTPEPGLTEPRPALSIVPQPMLPEPEPEEEEVAYVLECNSCQGIVTIDVEVGGLPDFCAYCDSCFECGASYLACMCYTPSVGWSGHYSS